MRERLLSILAGWTAGVLAVGIAAVVLESGAVDEPAAAQVLVAPPTTPPPTVVLATTTTTTSAPTTSTTVPVTTTSPPPMSAPGSSAARTTGPILLVWTYGGLPGGFSSRVGAIEQVTSLTTVWGDLVRLTTTTDATGTPVDTAPTWWAYPIDALAIDPVTYAPFAPEADQPALASLGPGQVILTETSAAIRRLGVGGVLTFASGTSLTVSAIVPDTSGSGAEVLVHRDDAARIGIDSPRFLLLTDTDRAAVEAAIEAATPPHKYLTLRGSHDTTWLRHGDRVDPQILVKQAFGEFVFHDGDEGQRDILIERAWVEANIVTEVVPVLGEITCHRLVVPLVRAAMEELQAAGKADTVNPSNYAGCYYPRRIAPGAGVSRHAWGIALDINVGADPRGDYATQDRALTDAFTSRGFNWGGDWVNFPDPAHYEKRAG